TVFLYKQDHGEVYAGGTNFVLRLNTTSFQIIEVRCIWGRRLIYLGCVEDPCQNVITVIEELNDGVFVCGTNGHRPQCWTLREPFVVVEQAICSLLNNTDTITLACLFTEGDLYAAAPFDRNGRSLQFRRTTGRRTRVSMYNNWVSEPTFIGSSWVKRENDPDNEKIYVFFREKNSDTNPEADHWISRVARVCKVDEGGSKRFFQNMWTTFIKARLVCGFPEESLYLNRLQDIYVLHDRNWNNTRVYAIFTSNWNSTAVCIYTIGMIEDVFEKSTFKGYNKTIPTPRPGHCIKNSRTIPLATVSVVKDHPEMAGWVHSVHYNTPFYVSSYNYTKITVDQVRGADNSVYNVLLLATGTTFGLGAVCGSL
uniref:Sema domain-containing protein n=1 Tax=Periophthalmus magnuspinnatus TaxID=409849 RepID=A0A3B3ZXK1_9GOBI